MVLPKGIQIPEDLIQNPFGRAGSYGKVDPAMGKFVEKLRIDAPTLPGMKGPDYSHFHLDGKGNHLRDLKKWPGEYYESFCESN